MDEIKIMTNEELITEFDEINKLCLEVFNMYDPE